MARRRFMPSNWEQNIEVVEFPQRHAAAAWAGIVGTICGVWSLDEEAWQSRWEEQCPTCEHLWVEAGTHDGDPQQFPVLVRRDRLPGGGVRSGMRVRIVGKLVSQIGGAEIIVGPPGTEFEVLGVDENETYVPRCDYEGHRHYHGDCGRRAGGGR
jgi:hypothetical protein